MWRLVFFLAGWCRIRITGASPQWILSALATRRVAFREFRKTDDFTAELRILKRDLPAAYAAAQRSMCDLELMQCGGFAATFAWVKKRPLFPLLLALTILTGTSLPRFVWFYEVTGNERVPAQKILRELDALGVGFGTYGKSIQPQWVKNHMLFRIPELQWLTVTQNGACATVVVRERPEAEPVDDRKTARNVVAARAGLVTRVSVLAGSSLCKPGDVVREGQLLVSAYADFGYKTQVSGALAEIYAKTWHRACTVLPETAERKQYTGTQSRCVSLVLGRKRWKLFGDSGFFTGNGDKMKITHTLTLPGGFSLPAAIEITTKTDYDTVEAQADAGAAQETMERLARERAQADMIAGTICSERYLLERRGGQLRLYSTLECEEMIARMVRAELFKDDANAND